MGEPAVKAQLDPAADATPHEPGQLRLDDRGNVTWVWADDSELQADTTMGAMHRMRALVDPSLDVVDDGTRTLRRLALKGGYDPYNSSTPARKPGARSSAAGKPSVWAGMRSRLLGR
ncbi:MAG: hypothetical protein ACR2I8_10830 [Steroidobacteraceae bacterium]